MKMIFKRITLVLVMSFIANSLIAKDFYVSPNGKNNNPGTKNAPFATIEKAKEAVQNIIAAGVTEDINVFLFGGVYTIEETLVFGLKDSPDKKFKLTYSAVEGEEPIISSGVNISKPLKIAGA